MRARSSPPAPFSASEDRFATVADLDRWIDKSQEHTYSGSAEGSHSGNVFTFALSGNDVSGFHFFGASGAAVENGNQLLFSEGDFLATESVQSFVAAHHATEEANGNAIVIKGGNFKLKPSDTTQSEKFTFTAAEGTGDMSGNRITVTGGDFGVQTMFFAANNTITENDVTDAGFTLADNKIEIIGGNFRADADVEVAYAEVGTLTRNRLEIKGLQNGRLNMAYAANTNSGNASENVIIIDDAKNLYVQVDLFAATAGSAAPSTLANNFLSVNNSSIDSSSFGAAMNASGDVIGNRVEISNTTLRRDSGSNIFVYGGLHVGYGGLDGRIAGNVIRLENVTLDLKENQTAFFIAGHSPLPKAASSRTTPSKSWATATGTNASRKPGSWALNASAEQSKTTFTTTRCASMVGAARSPRSRDSIESNSTPSPGRRTAPCSGST